MKCEEMIALLKIVREEVTPVKWEMIDNAISELQEEIAVKNNKASGYADLAKIANNIIKQVKKIVPATSAAHGAWIGSDGKQYVTNTYLALRFTNVMELEPIPEKATPFKFEKMFSDKGSQHYELPTVGEIKSAIAELKAEAKLKGKKKPMFLYHFGNGCYVNAEYLLLCVQATNAIEVTTKGDKNKFGRVIGPLFLDNEDETVEALLLPVNSDREFPKGFFIG